MTMCIETSSRHTATVTSTLFHFLSVLFVALFVTSAAQAGSEWTVSAIEGDAKIIKEGIQPVALSPGDELAEGDRVVTGETGRAVLTRGGSTIVVAPGTEMSIPLEKTNGLATRILQKVGTLFLNVEKKKAEHFEVVTPYLAAVVKGTSFTVNVDRSGAAVHVMEGLVQVADAVSGQAVFVRPGQTATRNAAAAGLDVKGQKASAPGQQKKAEAETDTAGLDNSNAGGNGKAQGGVNSAEGFATATEASDGKAGGNGKAIGRSFEIVSVETPLGTGPSPGSATGQINRSANSNAGGNDKSKNVATNVSGRDKAAEASDGKAAKNGKAIGRTLGVVSLDVAVVTVSLPGSAAAQANQSATSGAGGNSNGNGGGVDSGSNAAGNGGAGSANVASGNPSAGGSVGGGIGGGNPNAGGGNPNAGGGNPNAGGGNPNAGGGNPNAGGGNPNAGGGNGNGNGNGNG